MRRTGRRHASDYLEENEEIISEQLEGLDEENYDYYDLDEESADEELDLDEEKSGAALAWKRIGKVALVILVLIALFFISMKVTEIWLDRNQEPENYGTEIPAYSDNESAEDPVEVVENNEDEEKPDEEEEEEEKPSETQKPSESEKPSETQKPSEADKPSETTKPSTPSKPEKPETSETPEKPSTPETPSEPSKPVIIPGNPAA